MTTLRYDVLPGHCLAIMLAAWRGQSLVPSRNVAGLERAFNASRHPELAVLDELRAATVDGREPNLSDVKLVARETALPTDVSQPDPLVVA